MTKGTAAATPTSAASAPCKPAGPKAPQGKPFGSILASHAFDVPAKTKPQPMSAPTPPHAPQPGAPRPAKPTTTASSTAKDAKSVSKDEPLLELDPAARVAFHLAPPQHATLLPTVVATTTADHAAHAARTAETHALAASLVERASFWGDGARGLARLHFGTRAKGGLAGATVMLEALEGEVSVRVSGASDEAAVERLATRLRAKGITVSDDG